MEHKRIEQSRQAWTLPFAPKVTQSTYAEIAEYRPRYGNLFEDMAADLDEFISAGRITKARALADATGQHVNDTCYPQFFTGDLDAELVLVHLNPKQPDITSERYTGPLPIKTFEEYFDASRHFGERMYGAASSRMHRSPFDHKQIRFLQPFGAIEFVKETTQAAIYTNLQKVIDCKLQLELIPYGSANFDASAFPARVLDAYFERVVRVIAARPRRYVLFCGAVFSAVLEAHVIERHEFRLVKKDGNPDRMKSSFANLEIRFGSATMAAGWCPSWARQGIPMRAYAQEVRRRYR